MIPENGYCRNRQERCGKVTVSCRKATDPAGFSRTSFSWVTIEKKNLKKEENLFNFIFV
jgi:hypothetical protein